MSHTLSLHIQDGPGAPDLDYSLARRPAFSLATRPLGHKGNAPCQEARAVIHEQITTTMKTVHSYSLFHETGDCHFIHSAKGFPDSTRSLLPVLQTSLFFKKNIVT